MRLIIRLMWVEWNETSLINKRVNLHVSLFKTFLNVLKHLYNPLVEKEAGGGRHCSPNFTSLCVCLIVPMCPSVELCLIVPLFLLDSFCPSRASVCPSVCPSVSLSVCPSLCPSVCPPVRLIVPVYVPLCVLLFLCVSLCVSDCHAVCSLLHCYVAFERHPIHNDNSHSCRHYYVADILYERWRVYNSSQSMILQSMIPWMLIVI